MIHTNELSTAINQLAEVMAELIKPLADAFREIDQSFNRAFRHLVWRRRTDENLIEWGSRLEYIGLLDNPHYRWEYQKACLQWYASPVIWIWRKISER